MIKRLILAMCLWSLAGSALAANPNCLVGGTGQPSCNISDFSTVTSPQLTDEFFACQPSAQGCTNTDPRVTAVKETLGNIISFIRNSQFSGTPPITFNPSTGAIGLNIDSTLSVVGGQLHVIGGGGGGGVTSISQGTGMSFSANPITSSGTINLANTSVTPGSYTNTNLTVDQQGRITSATNGSGGTSGFSGQITVANACTGTSCTPVISCQQFNNGVLTSFGSGACTNTNFMLIQSGSALLIQTGSHLLIQ